MIEFVIFIQVVIVRGALFLIHLNKRVGSYAVVSFYE